jgi:LacI family transcriptional regulator
VAKLIGERERHGGRRTTLAAIAAEAGVSLAVVSKVLNGRPDVAQDTRDRVRRLLDDHHYARRSSPGRRGPRLFGVVFNGLDHPWAVEILRGIESWSTDHAAGIVVSAADLRSALDARYCDGVLLATTRLTAAQVGDLRAARVPVVVIDPASTPPADLASVGATNWAGGLAAADHLLDLGHRRIAVITGPANFHCSLARLDGYRTALASAGVPADPALVRYGDFSPEGAFTAAAELLALNDPPTAVFAGSDQQAFGVYQAARRRGLRIPEDLSVVGFDGLPAASWASPPLTTVWQPLIEMGGTAAQMLGDLVDKRPPHPNRVELSTELIVRESTARRRPG